MIRPLLLALLVSSTGCGLVSLEAAKVSRAPRAGSGDTIMPLPVPGVDCQAIDREYSAAIVTAGVLGVLGGSTGLASIPVTDTTARQDLQTTAVASAVGALAMSVWVNDRARRYTAVCGGTP
jgi:hypothetical protein